MVGLTKKVGITALAFSFLVLFTANVKADLLNPDEKTITYCFKLENVEDYKDYKFYLENELVGAATDLYTSNDDCFTSYKFGKTYFVAEKDGEKIKSDTPMQDNSVVKKDDERTKVEEIYKIKSISDGKFKVEQSDIVEYTDNGSKNGKSKDDDKSWLEDNWYFVAIPVVAGVLLAGTAAKTSLFGIKKKKI